MVIQKKPIHYSGKQTHKEHSELRRRFFQKETRGIAHLQHLMVKLTPPNRENNLFIQTMGVESQSSCHIFL